MRHLSGVCGALVPVVLSAQIAAAADWPRYRGPNGAGVAASTAALPAEWDDTKNVVWRAALPGLGTSSPIVWNDRIFLTAYSGYGLSEDDPGDIKALERHTVCLALDTGATLWDRIVEAPQPEQPFEGFLALHGYASNTPATDGKRVYVFFGRGGVRAYDLDGREQWNASVGQGLDGWGSAASVVLFDNLVILNASVESGSLVALDKETGREVWKTPGVSRCWGTPVIADASEGPELVVSSEGEIAGFDPKTGKKLWFCEGVPDYVCPSPVTDRGIVYAIGGRQGTALAVRAGGRGDVNQSHVVWRTGEGSNVASPLLYEGHLYWVSDKGLAYCLKADTGRVVYKERMASDRVYASIAAADRKLFALSRQDGAYVLPAEPRYEVIAHNKLENDTSVFNASPTPVGEYLLLRSDRYLYAIGRR